MPRPTCKTLFDRIAITPGGCLLWTGENVSPEGYGRTGEWYVHRLMYEEFVGPIPRRLQIDHLCRVRLCCSPAHLEAVTQRENILRGESACARHARKTTCINGHQFDGTRRTSSGIGRTCSTCTREGQRRRRGQKANMS